MGKTRAFVRYLKGKLVPGSLITTSGEYPKAPFSSGKWQEIPADLCCTPFNNCESCVILQGVPEGEGPTYVYGFALQTIQLTGKYLRGTIQWEIGQSETINIPADGDTYYFEYTYSDSAPKTIYLCIDNPNILRDFELGFGPGETVSLSNAQALKGLDEWDSDDMDIYSLDLSNITELTQLYHCCSLLTHINIAGSVDLNDVDLTNNALRQESVDHVLITLDQNGLSNGYVDLSGGTNAIPSAAGLAAKTSLEGKGWSVTVNP